MKHKQGKKAKNKNKRMSPFYLRDVPNVKALCESLIPKYQKIGEKIKLMMASGNTTIAHSDEKVVRMCDKLGLSCSIDIQGNISIRSKCDSWIIIDNESYWTLYHMGKHSSRLNEGRVSEKYHIQDVMSELEFALSSIKTHDNHSMQNGGRTVGCALELAKELVTV